MSQSEIHMLADRSGVPKQRARKPVTSTPPTDSNERKRVLNVLAQRRYRQRKKERHAQLEKVAGSISSSSTSGASPSSNPSPASNRSPSGAQTTALPDLDFAPFMQDAAQTGQQSPEALTVSLGLDQTRPNIFAACPTGFSSVFLPSFDLSGLDFSPSDAESTNSGVPLFEGSTSLMLNSPPRSRPRTPIAPDWNLWDSNMPLSAFLQTDDVCNASFTDERWMTLVEVDMLRAAATIATRLRSVDRWWDADAGSIFTTQQSRGWVEELPDNLRPTSTQLTTPHHPSLDILPWPSVRDKLIKMFDLPEEFWPRHPVDKEPLNVVRLAFDMDSGGMRVWGADPTASDGWEVDQTFVDAWWWALDLDVLTTSNRNRARRGLPRLRLKSPSELKQRS